MIIIVIVFAIRFLGKKTLEGQEIAKERFEKNMEWLQKREEILGRTRQKEERMQENLEKMNLTFEQQLYVYHASLLNQLNKARAMAAQYPGQAVAMGTQYVPTSNYLILQGKKLLQNEIRKKKLELEIVKVQKKSKKERKEERKKYKDVKKLTETELNEATQSGMSMFDQLEGR